MNDSFWVLPMFLGMSSGFGMLASSNLFVNNYNIYSKYEKYGGVK